MKKIGFIFSVMALFVLMSSAAFATPILSSVTGHYYEAIPGQYNWSVAKSAAEGSSYNSLSGYLATLTSYDENYWVWDNVIPGGHPAYFWLGGHQLPGSVEPDMGWGWITGEYTSWTNWNNGEPNNNSGDPSINEDSGQFWNNGKWNDVSGNSSNTAYGMGTNSGSMYYQGYIVEYGDPAVVPEPATMSLLGLGLAGLLRFRKKRVS